MLALTGAKADGWLPSLEYIKSPTIADSNAMIDEAAIAAGRRPSDIRRLLNIMRVAGDTPAEWIEQLSGLVLEHGFSGFFFGGDDPDMLRMIGEEIAPGVREAVDGAHSA